MHKMDYMQRKDAMAIFHINRKIGRRNKYHVVVIAISDIGLTTLIPA